MKHFFVSIISIFLFMNLCIAQQYTWVQKTSLPAMSRYESAGASLNGKGYFITGANFVVGNIVSDTWEYDPILNTWTQKANFPGGSRYGSCSFAIGNKIYFGTGFDGSSFHTDFYSFDPTTNVWAAIANFPGPARYDAVGFTIGNKGYVGFGYSPNFNDFYQYDPATNVWTQKANFPGAVRQSLATFAINGLGYVCGGADANSNIYDDLWQYNPTNDSWIQKANFPAGPRYATNGFALDNKGIVGGGWNIAQSFSDYYVYDPATNSWCQTATLPAAPRFAGDGFVIGQNAYVGLGRDNSNNYYNDFWKLEKSIPTFTITSAPCNLTVNFNNTIANVTSYQWSFGDGNSSSLSNPNHTYGSTGTYNVQLIVYYNCGTDTITQQVILTGSTAVSQFSYTQAACSYTINFANNSTGATSYFWNFGDGTTATTTAPSHQYAAAGNQTVTLLAITACDTDTFSIPISVLPFPATPVATFTPTVTSCSNTVTFTNSSTNGSSYIWLYGDGNSSTNSLLNHTYAYAASGNYTASLLAINSCDTDTIQQLIILPVINVPQPAFTTAQTPCTNVIQFSNTTTNSLSYLWSFGDATTSTLFAPLHQYATTGNFNVTLTAYGTCDTITIPVLITVAPIIPAAAILGYTVNSCDSTVAFNNASTGAINYLWSFGDGVTSSLAAPSHAYAASGNYTVTLTAYGTCDTSVTQQNIVIAAYTPAVAVFNFTTPPCSYQVTFTNQSSNALSYLWSFGDGNISSLQSPVYTYATAGSYTASLLAISSCDTDTIQQQIILPVINVPQPAFTTAQTPCTNAIQFSNTTTNALSYLWSFGDATTSTLFAPLHQYGTTGNFNVTLTAYGVCDTITIPVLITVAPIIPAAAILGYTVNSCDSSVSFNNASTGAINYLWSFGDGVTSSLAAPSHAYAASGNYTVTLTAYGTCDTSVTQQNIVIAAYSPAVAVFNFTAPPCSLQVTFTNQSSNALSYLWSFGDGNTSSLQSPVYNYATGTTYTVTLTATDICKSDTTSLIVNLTNAAVPVANFSNAVQPCDSTAISFQNQSLAALSYLWNFGDGSTSTDSIPYHIYANPGIYTVTLIAYNNCDNDTLSQSITVDSILIPVAGFNYTIMPCSGEVNFTSTSVNATTYLWQFADGQNSTLQNPSHTFATAGTYPVTLIINAGQPCTDSVLTPVTIAESGAATWFVPNCFTPNNDDLNDVFEITGIPDCSTYSYIIFNRWGQKVFETTATLFTWNGTIDSKNVPEGVYMYILTVDGQKSSGTISLLR